MNRKPDDEAVARFFTESARQIWTLGVDALNQTEKESRRLVGTIRDIGSTLQSQTTKTAGVAKQTVTGGKSTAGDALARIEQIFELRVARVLNALQIPTAKDIQELAVRVDSLSAAVEELNAKQARSAKAKPAPTTRRKKPATSKKAKSATKKTSKKATKKSKSTTGKTAKAAKTRRKTSATRK